MKVDLFNGDCLEKLKTLEDGSVDSIVTDPPYGLSKHSQEKVVECLTAWLKGEEYKPKGKGFMGKSWDAWVPSPTVWRECLRVLKPGGHLLAFAGTRSMDLMSMSIRLAGFELRDSIGYAHDGSGVGDSGVGVDGDGIGGIGNTLHDNDGNGAPLLAWCYGSGFPKSMSVSKSIDKAAGVRGHDGTAFNAAGIGSSNGGSKFRSDHPEYVKPTGITEEAKQWEGWGTSLKPAWEPVILARKPLEGNVADNVIKYGTGAINVDGCRIATDELAGKVYNNKGDALSWGGTYGKGVVYGNTDGRWPANVIHDGSDEVVGLFPVTTSGSVKPYTKATRQGNAYGKQPEVSTFERGGDRGSAARFFYCAKASKSDRGSDNIHPSVKPTSLLRYLCRLVTPPNGVVLDPFMGSGSTGKAAVIEGFSFIGCEMDKQYVEIAQARINHAIENKDS